MDAISYVAITRQSGLRRELQSIANNVANMGTTGYRQQGVVFTEAIQTLPVEGGSIAMTGARARYTTTLQGPMGATGGTFDLAINGDGFFQIETPGGVRLTRSGAFFVSENNEMVTASGFRVLDAGGAPIFVPPDAEVLSISQDGTLSADGQLLSRIGLVSVEDPSALAREDGVMFAFDGPLLEPADTVIMQGYLEGSNVNPVAEISRMIEVQRAYELGQKLLDREDERIRNVVRTLGQTK